MNDQPKRYPSIAETGIAKTVPKYEPENANDASRVFSKNGAQWLHITCIAGYVTPFKQLHFILYKILTYKLRQLWEVREGDFGCGTPACFDTFTWFTLFSAGKEKNEWWWETYDD